MNYKPNHKCLPEALQKQSL